MDSKITVVLIGALAGFIISIVSVIIKEFFVEFIKEKRKSKQTKHQTFKYYADPITRSAESLCWRLKEIFEQRGAFLLESNLRNEFFEYKFISTIYRLCSMIGWVRAIQCEYAYIDTSNKKGDREIENSLYSFNGALADGQHMELSILKELSKLWGIDIDKLSNEEQAKLAIKIEDIIYSVVDKKKAIVIDDLIDDKQVMLLQDVANCICDVAKCNKLSLDLIKENRVKAITEIYRIETWIYRDWQSAIGDVVLNKIDNSPRRYEVIGYGEFEKLYKEENDWIEQLKRIFDNLNVEIDDRFDARVGQLKRIYKSLIDILTSMNKFNENQATISTNSFNKLKEFANKLS